MTAPLFDRKLTKDEFLRYYALVGKVCGHNQDTARKLIEVHSDKKKVRSHVYGIWQGSSLDQYIGKQWYLRGPQYTLPSSILRDMLEVYAAHGESLPPAKLWTLYAMKQGKTFQRWKRAWEHVFYPRKRHHPLNRLDEIERHPEAEQAHYCETWLQPKDMEAPKVARALARATYHRQHGTLKRAAPAPAPTDIPAGAIQVVFKNPLEKGAKSTTARIVGGKPIAHIRAGGGAKAFWRGVFFTMEFAKEELG